MTIQILGMGCQKCDILAERTAEAARSLGIDVPVEKVTDPSVFVALGVLTTPALVVDGTVKVAGRVPTVSAIAELLR